LRLAGEEGQDGLVTTPVHVHRAAATATVGTVEAAGDERIAVAASWRG
jgi:hypothetical protein